MIALETLLLQILASPLATPTATPISCHRNPRSLLKHQEAGVDVEIPNDSPHFRTLLLAVPSTVFQRIS